MIAFIGLTGIKTIAFGKKRNSSKSVICAELTAPQPYLNSNQIKEVREKYKIHSKDTGSPEYQIAALSVRIAYMTEHIKKNPKDYIFINFDKILYNYTDL